MNPSRGHVWVTRPQPGATQTGDRLAALGFQPWVAPLTEVVGLTADLAPLADCAALVFTSANGARFFPPETASTLMGKSIYAVGAATADAVHALGFSTITIGPGDAASLAPLLADCTEAGDRIGYITGRQRSGTLEEALAKFDRQVAITQVYETNKVSQITYIESVFFETYQPRAVMVYSQLTAETLVDLIAAGEVPQNVENAYYIAISKRVAEVLKPAVSGECIVAKTPNEAGMIAALTGVDDLYSAKI